MKISVIGTGYVGLVTGTCFSELGHSVTCVDIDQSKVDLLNSGKIPIYEPGLTELVSRNIEANRLFFSSSYDSVKEANIIFLAVGTPASSTGETNLEYINAAAKQTAQEISAGAIIVIKSTVPVGTSKQIKDIVKNETDLEFHMVSNPEFLKEGTAVEDFMRPDRVIIGGKDSAAIEVVSELYSPLVRQGNPIYTMSNLSAEITKYAANCFLATKISFINEIARLCDVTGAEIEEVREGIISDPRIGRHFLYPGPGYGGSCFPKDVESLIHTGKELGVELDILRSVTRVNETQKLVMFNKVNNHFNGNLKGLKFALWGVAFKPNTDDVREAPAIKIAQALREAGAEVSFFDPIASKNFKKYFSNDEQVKSFKYKYDSLEDVSGVIIVTEWREFKNPDFDEMHARMKDKNIFDARNIYTPSKIKELGFEYYGIGRRV
ncbi:MAG: UDP-glucose/GDP-mannose dehydrogenase family protein [Bdellovibrionales bacterium]|jgi:UDPglucose 6-dehydrogenase|nr:UDP-glucose/GDP-mannose dehydrogenase family protein [Bdellovibrionales bacterium]